MNARLISSGHYTDTAGFTDHVFGLMHLLGFRFAPRICDLADKRLYIHGDAKLYPLLGRPDRWQRQCETHPSALGRNPAAGGVDQAGHRHRLADAAQAWQLSASERPGGCAPRVGAHRAHTVRARLDAERGTARRVQIGLNKGEAKNSLARAVFLNRLGELRDRSFENQRYRASGLNLVVAAIVLWNTVYLERAVQALRDSGKDVDDKLLPHLSPLGWEHINLTGDYVWRQNKQIEQGKFRPLRMSAEA